MTKTTTRNYVVPPRRKVLYGKLKEGTNGMYFILLECGHVQHHGWRKVLPKTMSCSQCTWGVLTIDQIFWDWNAIRWGHKKETRPYMERHKND